MALNKMILLGVLGTGAFTLMSATELVKIFEAVSGPDFVGIMGCTWIHVLDLN